MEYEDQDMYQGEDVQDAPWGEEWLLSQFIASNQLAE